MSDLQVFSATAMTVVLFAAAWGKLRAPTDFRRALGTYKVIPKPVIPVLVVSVPVVEIGLASLQWVTSLQPLVGIAIVLMFVAFTMLLLRSVLKGEEADCGCFGSAAPEKVSWFSIGRNVVLIALALSGALAAGGGATSATAAGLAGVGVGLLVLVSDQGYALFSKHGYRGDRVEG